MLAKLISGLHYYSSVPAQMLPESLHVNYKNPEAGAEGKIMTILATRNIGYNNIVRILFLL